MHRKGQGRAGSIRKLVAPKLQTILKPHPKNTALLKVFPKSEPPMSIQLTSLSLQEEGPV